MKRLGPKTIYALSALATIVLVAAAGLAASGIDIGRPKATDLPLVIARSASRLAATPASTIATAPVPAPAPAPAPQPTTEGRSASGGSAHSSAPTEKPVVVTRPADATLPDHEVVTPSVRESDQHRPGDPVPTPAPTPRD